MDQLQGGGLMLQRFQRLQPLLRQTGGFGVADRLAVLFRSILHKDVKEIAVEVGMDKMAVILDPADGAVLLQNAVFHMV